MSELGCPGGESVARMEVCECFLSSLSVGVFFVIMECLSVDGVFAMIQCLSLRVFRATDSDLPALNYKQNREIQYFYI